MAPVIAAYAKRRFRRREPAPTWAPIACALVGLSLLWMWRDALSTVVRDHGVGYPFDQLHGGERARVSGLGPRVFSNEAVPSSP